ncbi:MAG: amidohydrolase [Sphingopyxis sp.]|nr:amidohydrolase [Sphingopyxis sp.]
MKSAIGHLLLLLAGTAATPALAAPLPDGERIAIMADVDAGTPAMAKAALQIWDYAESGFQETKSSALLQKELTAAGFKVEAGVAGMPTAFVASFRNGAGPVIGLLAEFDALPGLSQSADPVRTARAGHDNGHACGHNLLGAASVASAIAIKRWMIAHDIKGELRVYGAPAEEGGSGKVFLVRAGLTKDVSAMLHWHPFTHNSAFQGRTLAVVEGKFRFHGVSAHAAASPERGRSALDAVEAMNMMVNQMREHVPQESRIHYVITDGGKAPNVVPETAEVFYYIRHPDQKMVGELLDRVVKAAEGAAMGTGTTVEFNQVGGTFDLLPNDTLGRLMYENLKRVPLPAYTPAEQAFIARIQTSFPPGTKMAGEGVQPYASGQILSGSTDVGDVSYTTPTAGVLTTTWAPGTPGHSWQAVAASGSTIGVKGAVTAAKTLALTVAQLFVSPDTLVAAKAELDKRRGPDFEYRSLMRNAGPDLDYRKNKAAD